MRKVTKSRDHGKLAELEDLKIGELYFHKSFRQGVLEKVEVAEYLGRDSNSFLRFKLGNVNSTEFLVLNPALFNRHNTKEIWPGIYIEKYITKN